jgi:hypothetical protein
MTDDRKRRAYQMTEATRIDNIGLSLEQWFQLPMSMRRRWWSETNYGKRKPSPDLIHDIKDITGKECRDETPPA